jgi:hypothetical protein
MPNLTAAVYNRFFPTTSTKQLLTISTRATRSLFGLPGRHAFGYGDLILLEKFLSAHTQWTNFVELGTGSGLTTLYLGIAAQLRGGVVHTFDQVAPPNEIRSCWPNNIYFEQADLFAGAGRPAEVLSSPATFAFFDNGDKAREINLYAPMLAGGCGFVVHDWGIELAMSDIESTIVECGFVPVLHAEAAALESTCRAWIRPRDKDGG